MIVILKQFQYRPLAHYFYALVSEGEMTIVDPERGPMQYYTFLRAKNAKSVAVIETHPHADSTKMPLFDLRDFEENPNNYTIGNVLPNSEVAEGQFPENTLSHPLNTLRSMGDPFMVAV